jgi:branched-chain amino acid transport system substrate-binding protein
MTTASPPDRRRVLKSGAAIAAASTIGFPFISHAQNKPVRMGMVTISSGRGAMVGASANNGAQTEIEKYNAAGGLNGRPVELIMRDSKGKPEEATRLARELVNQDNCDILFASDSSAAAFAIQEVAKELGIILVHNNAETSSLTADPKIRAWNCFRAARQGIHDSIAGGFYSAQVAKAKGLTKWMGCSPDYAYGRDSNQLFFEYVKHFHKDTEVVGETWPKLYQSDYTEQLTKILQVKPQALYSCFWGGDLTAFIDQSNIYNLFAQMQVFAINLADYSILTAIKNLPQGVHSGTRYLSTFPKTPENAAWAADYRAKYKDYPLNWSWENATGAKFVIEAMKKAQSTDAKKLAEVLTGMTIDSPFGVGNKLTMRASDNTVINYATGWGPTIAKEPFLPEVVSIDWGVILELETEWKKKMKYI